MDYVYCNNLLGGIFEFFNCFWIFQFLCLQVKQVGDDLQVVFYMVVNFFQYDGFIVVLFGNDVVLELQFFLCVIQLVFCEVVGFQVFCYEVNDNYYVYEYVEDGVDFLLWSEINDQCQLIFQV